MKNKFEFESEHLKGAIVKAVEETTDSDSITPGTHDVEITSISFWGRDITEDISEDVYSLIESELEKYCTI
jgi:hypothetical protein